MTWDEQIKDEMGVGVTHDVALDRKQGRRTGRPLGYGPFLLKLPYYNQKVYLVLDIFCFYKFYIFLHDNGQVYLS